MNSSLPLLVAGSLLLPCMGAPCGTPTPNKESTMEHHSRAAPPQVPPVVIDGVRYSQVLNGRKLGLAGNAGWLLASDAKSGERLWTARVYEVPIDPADEADVQEVYFQSMTRVPGKKALVIRNEAGRAFVIDVETREVSSAD